MKYVKTAKRAGLGALALAALVLMAAGCGSSAKTNSASSSARTNGGSTSSIAQTSGPTKQVQVQTPSYDHSYTGPDRKYFTLFARPTVKDGQPFKVGYSGFTIATDVLLAMQRASAQMVTELGGTEKALQSGNNPQVQVSQFQQLLSTGSNAIIAQPQVVGGLSALANQAKARHVPVVYIDPVEDSNDVRPDQPFSVNQAVDYAGYETMKTLAKELPKGATFAVLDFGPPTPQIEYLTQRLKYWGPKFGLKFVLDVPAATAAPAAYSTAASQILTKDPHVNVIVTFNDDSAVAAATAAKEAHLSNVKVATANGGDAELIPLIKSGTAIADYVVPWNLTGQQAAIAAYDLVTHQKLPSFIQIPGTVATKANVNEVTFVK